MKVIFKNQYVHPDWEGMGIRPETYSSPYVEFYAPNDSGGVTLKEIGPFCGCAEADEWIMQHPQWWGDWHPHLKDN